jgi:hypothetical protein
MDIVFPHQLVCVTDRCFLTNGNNMPVHDVSGESDGLGSVLLTFGGTFGGVNQIVGRRWLLGFVLNPGNCARFLYRRYASARTVNGRFNSTPHVEND